MHRGRGVQSLDDADLAQVAHILQRTTFGPFPGAPARALESAGSPAGVIDEVLAAPPVPFETPTSIDIPFDPVDAPILGAPTLAGWWFERMCSDEAGLHEKMMWFWHTHFTTNASKASFLFLWRQLRTFHAHALGNFRDLTKAMVVDPAMLMWLDGDASSITAPNENLGRELLELFTLGIGNYTEDDVRAAARSLAGWHIDSQTGVANFVPAEGPSAPDTVLGKTAVYTPDLLVDQILAQPAAAPFVVRKLWKSFIGSTPDDGLVEQWADEFRRNDYEIRPVVEALLRSEAFRDSAGARSRSGIEWSTATVRALEFDPAQLNVADLQGLGQMPYDPPNVAGWPDGGAWVSAASQFARAAFVGRLTDESLPGVAIPELDADDPVRAALDRCSIHQVSGDTLAGLQSVADALPDDESARSLAVLRAALMSPEFAVG